MESSSKKSEVADIPKRNRSLDLKSLYESRASGVKGVKIGSSDETGHVKRKKRNRNSRKEFPLSSIQPDNKKGRKDEVNGEELEQSSGKISSGKNQALHGISLAFSEDGKTFVIPKRPRGKMGRKKLKVDQANDSLALSNSSSYVETFKSKFLDTEEEERPAANLVEQGTHSVSNGEISAVKSSRRSASLNSRAKLKTALKPGLCLSTSDTKSKQNIDEEEVTQSGSGHVSLVGNGEVKGNVSNKKIKSKVDPKIIPKSGKTSLSSSSKIDTGKNKEKNIVQSASAGSFVKDCNTESKLSEKVEKKSYPNASFSNSKIKANLGKQSDILQASTPHEQCIAVNDGDGSPKMRSSKRRKKKDLLVVRDSGETSRKKSEPSAGSSVSNNNFTDEEDDDEENLEKNAARMLSSRFDPSCTGFSSRRRYSASKKDDRSSLLSLSVRDSFSAQKNLLTDGDCASADDKGRALRPRREDKAKGTTRKRRHFYEILPGDLDPYWVMSKRIKIFWPLDESWYYGLVDDYHSGSQLHHIKYDDRDEEWVNLVEEKFKILLLPCDAPRRSRSRKRAVGDKDSQIQEMSNHPDDSCSTENCHDSVPIASWLENQSQRGKAFPKTFKRQRNSEKNRPLEALLTCSKADDSNANSSCPNLMNDRLESESEYCNDIRYQGTEDEPLLESSSLSRRTLVYVRKRYRNKCLGVGLISRNFKERASSLTSTLANIWDSRMNSEEGIHYGLMNSSIPLWCFDDFGLLRLNDVLVKLKDLRFKVHLTVLPLIRFLFGVGISRIAYDTFMLQHGIIVSSLAVLLEMLFIDNNLGLKLLVYEGSLGQALTFVSLTLALFSQSNEQCNDSLRLPVTSMRFRFFSVQDARKQYVFGFYSFCKLQSAEWLYLESRILQHCLLIKQLSVSECTYEKMKELENGSTEQCKSRPKCVPSSHTHRSPGKKSMTGILPMGISWKACNARMNRSTYFHAASPGKSPQFVLSFTAAPTFFQSLHLQLLLESSFAWVNLHHQDSECVDDPVSEVAGSVGIPDTASDHEASEFLTEAPAETVLVSNPSSLPGAVDSASSNSRKDSESTCMIGTPSIEKVSNSKQTGDAELKLQKGFVHEANPAGSIKSVKRGRTSSILTPLEYHSPLWLDDTTTSAPRAFSNGPKKPRTQVQYSLPVDGYDLSSKQKMPNSRALPYKRIRRASLKRISESHENGQKNLDLLTCVGNILVSHVDKGWREHGANVVLEVADRNEWRLAVKVSGVTKYSHKVKHILQPGSTNRYSHAMMWKGGKDWALEFPDRSQWMLFKEMHEECYNRNIRAASVKNIPIPGVRLVEESDVYGNDAPFSRNSPRYIRQVQTDVERAMDQSRMLYDMDTDDEQWLLENNNAADRQKYGEISEEYLEKAMDMFEKVSYAHPLRENFPASEIEELVMGLVSVEAGKAIYEHWRQKREKTGMPLIRHLQPPLWERYQQQLKEWEKTVSRAAAPFSDGTQLEKPPMFAFCLKPRGLEILNRGSKQRSHRRLPVSGSYHASSGNHDSSLSERRWSGGHGYIDERLLHPSNANYSSDVLVLSPRDASLKTGWKGNPTFYKNKQKKLSAPSYPPPPPKQLMSGQDLLEYNARDASGAASHARRLAKLKKYRAHRLFCRADIAIQRAAAALMTAEAIKDSTTEKNAD